MHILVAQRPGSEPQPDKVPMDDLLAESDIVSLHCPLVTNTFHLINAAALQKMKSTAILINTPHGAIVS